MIKIKHISTIALFALFYGCAPKEVSYTPKETPPQTLPQPQIAQATLPTIKEERYSGVMISMNYNNLSKLYDYVIRLQDGKLLGFSSKKKLPYVGSLIEIRLINNRVDLDSITLLKKGVSQVSSFKSSASSKSKSTPKESNKALPRSKQKIITHEVMETEKILLPPPIQQ